MKLRIDLPEAILNGIFDECDRHAHAETGGRLLGFWDGNTQDLRITIKALIGPGPNAKRSAISLHQDGEYQERVFRAVEQRYPEIQHLGNWHSHHCNGLAVLSHGDSETYRRIVNSPRHNTDFFYALLVTRKVFDSRRYCFRHYLLLRGRERIHQVDEFVSLRGSILEL